jgi:hypothetical protein
MDYDIYKTRQKGDRKVDSKAIKIAKKYLSDYLFKATNNPLYSIDSPFIQNAITSIKNVDTYRQLYDKIAKIIVYTTLPEAKTFIDRLKEEYYLPEILQHLSDVDKLPEVFDSKLDNTKTITYISYLVENINKIIENMINDETQTDDIAIKAVCSNDMENAENVINYFDKNDGLTYCFDKEKLLQRFRYGNFKNQYNDKNFSRQFIEQTLEKYDIKVTNNQIFTGLSSEIEDKYGIKMEIKKQPLILDDLYSLIKNSIDYYEKTMKPEEKFKVAFSFSEEKDDNKTSETKNSETKKDKSTSEDSTSSQTSSSGSSSSQTSSSSNSDETSSSQSTSQESNSQESNSSDSVSKDNKINDTKDNNNDSGQISLNQENKSNKVQSNEVQSNEVQSNEVNPNEVNPNEEPPNKKPKLSESCNHCGKQTGDNFYRTMKVKKNVPTTFVFCCAKCMEDGKI